MKNIQVLDCTLRDGGRIIDCKFPENIIGDISRELTNVEIDIIELGFLRRPDLVSNNLNTTFFTKVSQMVQYIPVKKKNTIYVAFIDYDMYDFSLLEKCDKKSIDGIRVGFTKKQWIEDQRGVKVALNIVKQQGYLLFVQGVNSLAYSDRELLDIIDVMNEIKPYSFGIVDTYGSMYLDDIVHYYNLVDYNLDNQIRIDVHSHNNFQLAFAFAQEIVRLANGKRNIILDATLNGMGKCAGNLNTELVVDYLNRKKNYNYDIDLILDIIDRYIYPIKNNKDWGYSIPGFMAGIYKLHPNNIIYLTEKYRLNSRDIKYIVSSIAVEKRQKYDYENIQKLYRNYCESKVDDQKAIEQLRERFKGKTILVLAPGKTIEQKQQIIDRYIKNYNVLVVGVNFVPKKLKYDYLFYANTIHWEKVNNWIEKRKCILTSNIHTDIEGTLLIDYSGLIVEDSAMGDNSTIMLLNLLKRLEVRKIMLAGFDGLSEFGNNYVDYTFPNRKNLLDADHINREITNLFEQFKEKIKGKIEVEFLTPSLYNIRGMERNNAD
jgi:4-hydroxy 2-oxovalerate aldolase